MSPLAPPTATATVLLLLLVSTATASGVLFGCEIGAKAGIPSLCPTGAPPSGTPPTNTEG